MRVKQLNRNAPGLETMTDGRVQQVHQATIRILEKTGVKVCEPESLALFSAAGAVVEDDRVKMPGWLVEEALRFASKAPVLAARDGAPVLSLEKNRIYYGTGSEVPYTIDLGSGQRRRVLKEDVGNAARLSDAAGEKAV